MAEVRDCPRCGDLFNYTGVRDVCHKCAQSEEEMYQIVYRFLRKRENRASTVELRVKALQQIDWDELEFDDVIVDEAQDFDLLRPARYSLPEDA